MYYNKIAMVVIGVLFVGGITVWASENKEANIKTWNYVMTLTRYDKISHEKADEFAESTIKEYSKISSDLLDLLKRAKNNYSKTIIIYQLGSLRSQKSVRTLVDMIDFKAEHIDLKLRFARWGTYPAQEALEKIGMPSVNRISEVLAEENNPLRIRLMLIVMNNVLGYDLAECKLKNMMERAKATERNKYEQALKLLHELKIEGPAQFLEHNDI